MNPYSTLNRDANWPGDKPTTVESGTHDRRISFVDIWGTTGQVVIK